MLLNKKAVRSINSFGNEEPLKNANPGRLKDKKRLIYIRPRQGNEFIIENEDDQLIQTWRKRVDEFVSKCSRRPQPTVTRRKTRTKKVNDRLGRSANIYGYQNMTVMSNVWTVFEPTFHRISTPRKPV